MGIPIKPGHNNHTPGFTEFAKTDEAHEATLKASAALAVVACRALTEPGFIEQVDERDHPDTSVPTDSSVSGYLEGYPPPGRGANVVRVERLPVDIPHMPNFQP